MKQLDLFSIADIHLIRPVCEGPLAWFMWFRSESIWFPLTPLQAQRLLAGLPVLPALSPGVTWIAATTIEPSRSATAVSFTQVELGRTGKIWQTEEMPIAYSARLADFGAMVSVTNLQISAAAGLLRRWCPERHVVWRLLQALDAGGVQLRAVGEMRTVLAVAGMAPTAFCHPETRPEAPSLPNAG